MNAKERATEIYKQHIALAATDGRLFRKTVMDQLMAETGCSLASAATHYNNCKKSAPVEGLGRAAPAPGVRKLGNAKPGKKSEDLVPDEECFAVMELIKNGNDFTVGRYQSFILQGDASEKFDEKVEAWPMCAWVMIKGLGPNSGDTYRLGAGEAEIKRHKPAEMAEEVSSIA